ncbi:MAG: hypothetical protein QM731_10695 [Chitinophagaceae bacterium]
MTRSDRNMLLWYIYDAICFAGVLSILAPLERGIEYIIAGAIALFLIPFFSKDKKTHTITFAIIYTLIAWLSWTGIITFFFTDMLYKYRIIHDHSIWLLFSFLIPVVLAIFTLIWHLKYRKMSKWYGAAYLLLLSIAVFIAAK